MKIWIRGLLAALSMILVICLSQVIKTIHHMDTSMHPTCATVWENDTASNHVNPHIWLASYAHGQAHEANQRALMVTALNKGAHFFFPYTSKHLDPDFVQKNATLLQQKRGAGYWVWKPHVILKTLKLMPDGDILIFADSGCLVVGSLGKLAHRLKTSGKQILVFENFHPNGPYVKRDLLRLMNMDTSKVRGSRQLQGGFLVLQNTPQVRDFIGQWQSLCENEKAVTDSPSPDEYPDFIDHRHDQAILSLLSLRFPHLVLALPHGETQDYFHLTRRRKMRKGSVFLRYYVSEPWRTLIHWTMKVV